MKFNFLTMAFATIFIFMSCSSIQSQKRIVASSSDDSGELKCLNEIPLVDGSNVGCVVSRLELGTGVDEYVKDFASKLVWSPEARTGGPKNDGKMNWVDANKYCEAKTDLGLSWDLPNKGNFKYAFNPDNKDKRTNSYNLVLIKVLDTKDRFLWSSATFLIDNYAWRFNGNNGYIFNYFRDELHSVRCVGR